jgi:uncharacterized protein (TIGR02271 family)
MCPIYTPKQPHEIEDLGCVAGLFRSDSAAEDAVEDLKEAGFTQSEIGVATSGHAEEGAHETFWSKVSSIFGKSEHAEDAEELEGSLRACGLPQNQAQYFNRSIADGDILVTVRAIGDRAIRARDILREAGADIGMDTSKVPAPQKGVVAGERRIQLLGEVLRVHKELVQRGEVRLRKEVVTDTQNLEVPVSREELIIERVSGQGREASGQVGSGEKEIRVPLSEERVHVEKKPVVSEEVRVGKRQVQDTKRVSDSVRHEELRSEHEGDVGDQRLRDIGEKKRRPA